MISMLGENCCYVIGICPIMVCNTCGQRVAANPAPTATSPVDYHFPRVDWASRDAKLSAQDSLKSALYFMFGDALMIESQEIKGNDTERLATLQGEENPDGLGRPLKMDSGTRIIVRVTMVVPWGQRSHKKVGMDIPDQWCFGLDPLDHGRYRGRNY